jgi:hypothetical protein
MASLVELVTQVFYSLELGRLETIRTLLSFSCTFANSIIFNFTKRKLKVIIPKMNDCNLTVAVSQKNY